MTCQKNKKESSKFTSIAKHMENSLRKKKVYQTSYENSVKGKD